MSDKTDAELAACSRPEGHCWHETGVVLTSNPPWIEQICCWCAQMRGRHYLVRAATGHGPHQPDRFRWWYAEEDE